MTQKTITWAEANPPLTDAQRAEVLRRYKDLEKPTEIAVAMGVSLARVGEVIYS